MTEVFKIGDVWLLSLFDGAVAGKSVKVQHCYDGTNQKCLPDFGNCLLAGLMAIVQSFGVH